MKNVATVGCIEHLAGERRPEAQAMTEHDLYYLRSILTQLRGVRASLRYGPTLGGEILADNIDWLDCFIDKHERAALEPKP